MTKLKSSDHLAAPPPPLPPPLNTGSDSSTLTEPEPFTGDAIQGGSSSFTPPEGYTIQSTSKAPKDAQKYFQQPPLPPAFHAYPQLAHQPQAYYPNQSVPRLPPYQNPGQPQPPNYYLGSNPYSSWAGNNYAWRRNVPPLAFDPASHGVISRLAEERTRSTFGSIEAILNAFSSLNMILDSTYSAIHGSFKTITGVADQLIFVRNHLAEIALVPRVLQIVTRFLRWLLSAFGLDKSGLMDRLGRGTEHQAWNEALASGSVASSEEVRQLLLGQAQSGDSTSSSSSPLWPIFVFFSLVLGTPYIIWRLLGAPGSIPRTNNPEWTLSRGRHFVAVGLHAFQARNPNELSFAKDAILFVKPESLRPGSKWLIAALATDQSGGTDKIGLIPLNYVKLIMK